MLNHLCVHNYTLVDALELDFKAGLTTLTGETGAGKSLLLGAISLAIGLKPRGDAVMDPDKNTEIIASFDITKNPKAQTWLQDEAIPFEDHECILKRVVSTQGRSRCWINGRPVTVSQLQAIGQRLVNIHGQHENQLLTQAGHQRRLLDRFGSHTMLLEAVESYFNRWSSLAKQLNEAESQAAEKAAQRDLLSYQVDELDSLALTDNEVVELEQKHKQLSNAQALEHTGSQVVSLLSDDDSGIQNQLYSAIEALKHSDGAPKSFDESQELLSSALVHIQEALSSIEMGLAGIQESDDDLPTIEDRLSAIYTLARKHKVQPEQLFEHHQALADALQAITHSETEVEGLQKEVAKALEQYHASAIALSEARANAAKKLERKITQRLQSLNMTGAVFTVECHRTAAPSRYGSDALEFLISTVAGKPPAALQDVASGGELSRIGLAIQVETVGKAPSSTLIFDEVDAGIGGETGNVVGSLLRQLGDSCQVMCVTHLAQVASKAHQHLFVSKTTKKGHTHSSIQPLQGDAVKQEIARMVGGSESTAALKHAEEMLAEA